MAADKPIEFRDYAAREVTALAERLTKAAAEAAERAARAADEEGRQAVDALRAEMQSALKKTAEDGQKVADTLRAELQSTVKQKAAVAATLKETQEQLESVRVELDSVRADLAGARAESDSLRGSVEAMDRELEGVRGDLATAIERGEIISGQLAEARQVNEHLEAIRDELAVARDEEVRARTMAEAAVRETRESLEITAAALAKAEKKVEKAAGDRAALEETVSIAHSQTEAAEAKLVAVTDLFNKSAARVKILERAQQDHERVVQELESRLKNHAASPASSTSSASSASSAPIFDDLLAGFQALESAATMSDVLTTLVEQLAAQFARVALFRVRKSHLQGEHQIGFDLSTDIGKVVLPLGMDSLPARAVSSGLIERLSGSELKKDGAGAPFTGSPSFALAIPIVAAGETLAVVYADDSGGTKNRRAGDQALVAARFAEAMQYHAVALLMRMTNELKARAELQTYAQSLLRELEQMYSGDQQSGRPDDELQARLQGNLDYARSIFESRVALEGGGAAALLDDEINAVLETASETPFAQHLAAVSGRSVKTRNTAEAS